MEHIVWVNPTPIEGWGRIRFRDDSKARFTLFVPLNVLAFLGLTEDRAYKITTESIEHEYI